MSSIYIDTEKVALVSSSIRTILTQTDECLDQMQSAVQKLGDSWAGIAANGSSETFHNEMHNLKRQSNEQMNMVANFLGNCVGARYNSSEKAIKTNADAFK